MLTILEALTGFQPNSISKDILCICLYLLGYKTYEDIFGAVRNGDVFAAIINSDVAAYRQDEFERGINKLAVTALINIEIPVKMMVNKHRFKPIHCDSNIHKKAVIATLAKHRKRLNVSFA